MFRIRVDISDSTISVWIAMSWRIEGLNQFSNTRMLHYMTLLLLLKTMESSSVKVKS